MIAMVFVDNQAGRSVAAALVSQLPSEFPATETRIACLI